ncbi:MAG: hypothetical protein H0U28_06445, partial [Nocardioidaceae bacterium]|nr:hypothetical protein [Nocardioidaceae bacterium]
MACQVDLEALEAVIASWTAGQLELDAEVGRLAVAVDGKTVRGGVSGVLCKGVTSTLSRISGSGRKRHDGSTRWRCGRHG